MGKKIRVTIGKAKLEKPEYDISIGPAEIERQKHIDISIGQAKILPKPRRPRRGSKRWIPSGI